MTAVTHQRRELTDKIVDLWHGIYKKEGADERHMMITALLSAYAHELPVKKLREWRDLLATTKSKGEVRHE